MPLRHAVDQVAAEQRAEGGDAESVDDGYGVMTCADGLHDLRERAAPLATSMYGTSENKAMASRGM